ncbi:hypothetical protein P3S68_023341 [Capsicum galapagoense]
MSVSESLPSSSSVSRPCKSLGKINMSPTLSKTLSCKYEYLYEDVLPPENKISSTYLPLLKKACNPWMQIHSLVQQNPKGVKEFIAASRINQHPILVTQEEQFITQQMPEDFPR